MRRWREFARRAKYDQGAYGVPEMPTVEFLCRNVQTAVNFALPIIKKEFEEMNFYEEGDERGAAGSVKPEAKPPVKLIAQPKPSKPEERPMTYEEMMAILAED